MNLLIFHSRKKYNGFRTIIRFGECASDEKNVMNEHRGLKHHCFLINIMKNFFVSINKRKVFGEMEAYDQLGRNAGSLFASFQAGKKKSRDHFHFRLRQELVIKCQNPIKEFVTKESKRAFFCPT